MPPTTLRIKTLKDGVGKQASSKRLPSEAEELINTVITVERSAEKRPGTFVIPCYETDGTTKVTYGDLDLPDSPDLYFYWYEFSPNIKYLITIDYGGTGTDDLLYVHQVDTSNRQFPSFKTVTTVAGTEDQKAYVRWNNDTKKAEDVLEVSAIGASLLILNKTVYTGFTSGLAGKTFDFNGEETITDDLIGIEARYLSASFTDPEGLATIYVANRAYVADQRVYLPVSGNKVYRAIKDMTAAENTAITNATFWEQTTVEVRKIPVEDFIYADPSKAYLGQSLNDASDLNLPPKNDDHTNSNDQETLLAALYPTELAVGTGGGGSISGRTVAGSGKVYYLANGYGEFEAGYYIVRSVVEKPYFLKIRTPDAYSVIDNKRMPLVLFPSEEGMTWTLELGDYDVRTSGTKEQNPGPSIWKNGRQVPLSSTGIFRNRLWFGAADTVFSSEVDNFGNFFLKDPFLIVDTDPIDVRLSSNKYSPVSSITPFESFLFVNTTADQQFTLQGSQNQITPYTAELGSASFFSTAPLIKPLLMGSQVYFFDANRLYIFLGSRAVNIQRSLEVSKGVPNYLPTNWGALGVINAYDTLFMTDKDAKNTVYGYTNRYQGDQIIQNAFFKHEYPWEIEGIYSQEEYIYFITKNANGRYYLVSQRFREDQPTATYLDNTSVITTDGTNAVYSASTNTTALTFTGIDDIDNNELIFGWEDLNDTRSGTILTVVSIDRSTPGTTVVTCKGNVADVGNKIFFGKNFTMTIVLNPQYQRDQQNNVIDGVLSLRSMHCRHFNTGAYRVIKTIRGRTSVTTEYSPFELDLTLGLDVLPLENVFPEGQTVSKIFGFSDETSISIVSDTPNPVNISQIEIKGIFTPKYSTFVR